jgi:hypothetical protein
LEHTVRELILIGVILTFATSVVGLITALTGHRKLSEIRVTVNGNLRAQNARVVLLTRALIAAGVQVPADIVRELTETQEGQAGAGKDDS